jgi:hypothetical protein
MLTSIQAGRFTNIHPGRQAGRQAGKQIFIQAGRQGCHFFAAASTLSLLSFI